MRRVEVCHRIALICPQVAVLVWHRPCRAIVAPTDLECEAWIALGGLDDWVMRVNRFLRNSDPSQGLELMDNGVVWRVGWLSFGWC